MDIHCTREPQQDVYQCTGVHNCMDALVDTILSGSLSPGAHARHHTAQQNNHNVDTTNSTNLSLANL